MSYPRGNYPNNVGYPMGPPPGNYGRPTGPSVSVAMLAAVAAGAVGMAVPAILRGSPLTSLICAVVCMAIPPFVTTTGRRQHLRVATAVVVTLAALAVNYAGAVIVSPIVDHEILPGSDVLAARAGTRSDDTTPTPTEPTDPSPPTRPDESANTPEDVRQAYMAAYENKSFGDVVNSACATYKNEYGTDTSELEQTLAPYDITATAHGQPAVDGDTATADIDLELSTEDTTERPSIFIKIVEEDGEWRFCGEGEA